MGGSKGMEWAGIKVYVKVLAFILNVGFVCAY